MLNNIYTTIFYHKATIRHHKNCLKSQVDQTESLSITKHKSVVEGGYILHHTKGEQKLSMSLNRCVLTLRMIVFNQ